MLMEESDLSWQFSELWGNLTNKNHYRMEDCSEEGELGGIASGKRQFHLISLYSRQPIVHFVHKGPSNRILGTGKEWKYLLLWLLL